MLRPRLMLLAAVVPLLAACDSSPPPPAPPAQPAAVQTPVAPTPPAPTPVAATPAPASTEPASDQLIRPVLGEWAVDLNDCGEESSTITIADNSFSGAENSCEITGFADNGDGSVTATLRCDGGTERVAMEPLFAPSGEGIDLTYIDRGGEPITVLRCD